MTLRELRAAGYRSLRDVRLSLAGLDVLTGANGCGKSNFYRALVLIAAAAQGTLARTLAEEGGMPSALWAGPRRKGPVRMTLGAACAGWDYEIACGLPGPTEAAFELDPLVKEETVRFTGRGARPVTLMERKGPSAWLRDRDGKRVAYPVELLSTEAALSQIREPHNYPELAVLREEMMSWRFYHHFRTDADSPLRRPQVGVHTPMLSADGRDLAAALKTAYLHRDRRDLDPMIEAAFPGSALEITGERGRYEVALTMPGIERPFEARELSDGTLRYLCLFAALMSARLPSFIALNEPETSIHPGLLEPLARMIVAAAKRTQLCVVTHSPLLAGHLETHSGRKAIRLEKIDGETRILGQGLDGRIVEDKS